jgi:uncharacterized protein
VYQPSYRIAIENYIRVQARPPDKFSHQARLYRLACKLADGQAFDDDVLHAAAWLHDLGVFIGHRPEDLATLAQWDHIAYVINNAPHLLEEFGFPQQKIPNVIETIRTHLPSARPISFEGVLLRDADILEQLGAIGILRTVSKVGRDTRFLRFSDAVAVLKKNVNDLPHQLQLESARRQAEPRIKALRSFLDAAVVEADGIDF